MAVEYKLPADARLYIGVRIRRWREKCGRSIADLAEITGLARSTIGDWERGRISPSIFTLYRLAMALNCQPWDLLPKEIELEKHKPKKLRTLPKTSPKNRSKHSKANGPKKNKLRRTS